MEQVMWKFSILHTNYIDTESETFLSSLIFYWEKIKV